MLQLILILALGPIAYIAFRLYWAMAKVIFNFAFFLIVIVVVVGLSLTNKPSSLTTLTQQAPGVTSEDIQISPCATVDQLLSEPLGLGELCDRYYKGQQCMAEIEAGFQRTGHQLVPMAMCGAVLSPPVPVTFSPESFDNKVAKFMDDVPAAERDSRFVKLHALESVADNSLTLDEVRNRSNLSTFLAFAKPSGDSIRRLKIDPKSFGGTAVLEGVPMFTPFTGIVRGVYQRTPVQECSLRLRDHSLCIERDGSIKCNIYRYEIAENEQVCVDYLIR